MFDYDYLITGDFQLQQGPRYDDAKLAMNNIMKVAEDNGIGNIIVAGDVYERNDIKASSPEEVFFIKWLRQLLIKNIHVTIIVGNHDIIAGYRHLFSSLGLLCKELFPVYAINVKATPELMDEIGRRDVPKAGSILIHSSSIEYGYNQNILASQLNIIDAPTYINNLILIPYLDKNMLNEAGMSYREMMLQFIQKGSGIIISHCDVVGAEPERGKIVIRDTITVKDIESDPSVSGFFSGHIHKHQNLGKKKPIVYCGSPIHTTFASSNDPKGVVLLNSKTAEWKFVELPTRKQVEIDYYMEEDPDEVIDGHRYDNLEENVKDAYVKIRFIYHKGCYNLVKKRRFEQAISDMGAYRITPVPVQLGVSNETHEIIETKSISDEEVLGSYLREELGITDTLPYVHYATKYISREDINVEVG